MTSSSIGDSGCRQFDQNLPRDLSEAIWGVVAKRNRVSKSRQAWELRSPSSELVANIASKIVLDTCQLYYVCVQQEGLSPGVICDHNSAISRITQGLNQWRQVFFSSLDLKSGGAFDLSEEDGVEEGALAIWVWGQAAELLSGYISGQHEEWLPLDV